MEIEDLFKELYKDVIQKAKEKKVSRIDVTNFFMEAYSMHKDQHGSFKYHPRYMDVMSERYRWMHNQTLKYIDKNAK